jgi:hypothetical protein
MLEADILLLVQNIDDFSAETIPSKVYEYLMARRPILGLVYRSPELAGMLESLGHTSVTAEDVGAVRAAIAEIHRRRERSAVEPPGVSPYTTRAAVERLVAIAERTGTD